jgi:pectinesterase
MGIKIGDRERQVSMKRFSIISILLVFAGIVHAQVRVVVDQSGKGDFKTITAALDSLQNMGVAEAAFIFIKNGIYPEKLYITKANLVIEGEDREKTIITTAIARDQWRCRYPDDWGVATLNVGADNLTLRNLTVANSFGFDYKGETLIPCPADTVTGQRRLVKAGHQMALRTMNATKMKAINCHFRAFGGDTVSPWDVENGMWYFKDCIMEGGVDFYCPRGWAWAENCEFIAHSGTASIWHDGSRHEDSKTVLKNCRFKGFDGFSLGRYHRDAQFYLIDCDFAANMKDAAIYRVPTPNNIQWGHRVYYYNCHRQGGGDFSWYQDNLPQRIKSEEITASWVFGNRWNPMAN